MPMPYGPMKPETLARRRATAAGKPHGFALWTPEKRQAVAGMGRVCASWEQNPSHWTREQAKAMSAKAVGIMVKRKAMVHGQP